jgi:hypothetical protein
VNSGLFLKKIPSKDLINIYKKIFFRRSKRQRNFPPFFYFYFISFINLCSPLVFPLAHPRELKTYTPMTHENFYNK